MGNATNHKGKAMKTKYNYVIIKENYPELERESVVLTNKYSPKKKYAYINKGVHADGSESIYFIEYSNDLQDLQRKASGYVSWYNYPLGVAKNIQGYLREI
jgi:predicted glycosyltransferase